MINKCQTANFDKHHVLKIIINNQLLLHLKIFPSFQGFSRMNLDKNCECLEEQNCPKVFNCNSNIKEMENVKLSLCKISFNLNTGCLKFKFKTKQCNETCVGLFCVCTSSLKLLYYFKELTWSVPFHVTKSFLW